MGQVFGCGAYPMFAQLVYRIVVLSCFDPLLRAEPDLISRVHEL